MELSCSNIIFFIFFLSFDKRQPRKKIIVFQETETLKGLLIFQGIELFKPKLEKISYTSGNGGPEKISYIFSKENCSYISGKGPAPPPPPHKKKKKSLYFREWNFLRFQETDILKNLLYFRK